MTQTNKRAAAQPRSKKQAYDIMLTSTQTHRVRVVAESAEAACKQLQRKAKHSSPSKPSFDSVMIQDNWSDPTEAGEAWMVFPAVSSKDASPDSMTIWNGKTLRTQKIDDAVRRLSAAGKKSE